MGELRNKGQHHEERFMVSTSRETKTMSAQVLMRNDGCQRSIIWVHGLRFKPKLISLAHRVRSIARLHESASVRRRGPWSNAADQPTDTRLLSALPQYAGVRFTQGGSMAVSKFSATRGSFPRYSTRLSVNPTSTSVRKPGWEMAISNHCAMDRIQTRDTRAGR